MNNIFKKLKISLVIVGIVVGVGYLANNGGNNIEKDNTNESINNSNESINNSNEVLLSKLDKEILQYEDMESDYKEIERLENILNNEYFILINRENKLAEDYIPSNLKKCEAKFLDYVQDNNLENAAADAVKKMFAEAAKDGISLVGVSGYRSYGVQKELYDTRMKQSGKERTRAYTAEPGASEHQSGLAIDILCDEYSTLDEGFENTDAFRWLNENCYKYGFILRYLKGKEDITGYNYEPWHFRYVGEDVASYIYKNNLILEDLYR